VQHNTLVAVKEVDGLSEKENAAIALGRAFDAVEHEVTHHFHRNRFRPPSGGVAAQSWRLAESNTNVN
jgi:hypothetical protein